jgi:hypothetical protein
MSKLVKESIDEPVNETVKYGGHTYDIFRAGDTKVFAGPEGLLGKDGDLISWDLIKKLMQKLNVK